MIELDKPVRMLDHPFRVDAHVVGDHIGSHPYPVAESSGFQVLEGFMASELPCDHIVIDRIRRGRCFRIAGELLDLFRSRTPLPYTDKPQAGDAPPGHLFELLIRDLIEPGDGAAVFLRELEKPHIGALGNEHEVRHPVEVGTEPLELCVVPHPEFRRNGLAGTEKPWLVLFLDKVHAPQDAQQQVLDDVSPVGPDILQLAVERVRRSLGRRSQKVQQGLALGSEDRPAPEKLLQVLQYFRVSGPLFQQRIVEELDVGLEGRVLI